MIMSHVLLKTLPLLVTKQVNSTLEIDNSVSADDDHQSGGYLHHGTNEAQRMSSCGRVVGMDEPLKMGASSKKSLCSLADATSGVQGSVPKLWGNLPLAVMMFIIFDIFQT